MKRLYYILPALILVFSSCMNEEMNKDLVKIQLNPGQNDGKSSLRWSPKGEKIKLIEDQGTLLGKLFLGPDRLSPVNLRLSADDPDDSFNKLEIDIDRDGIFNGEKDTVLTCKPASTRGKLWSSFSGELIVPFAKMKGQKAVENIYPLSFWYVLDPQEPNAEKVLRFSRKGWMEGQSELDGAKINILITESTMDGIFDENDAWAISFDSTRNELFQSKNAKAVNSHNWLGEQAYGVDSLLPSGRVVWIKKVDPQITRAEEEAQKDFMAKDRAAKRSGAQVEFLHDYKEALDVAKKEGKTLFIDFETTWCGPCKSMDKWVYTADNVVEASQNLICVKVDGDDNRDLVKKFEVTGYPTLILVSPDGDLLKRESGYQSVEKTTAFLK